MSLEIKTSDKRFTVSCKYEKSLIAYFNTIEKRYFDWEKETWSFPVQKLESFKEYIAKNNIGYTEVSTKNSAKLLVKNDKIELSFSTYIKNFQDYVNIPGAQYLKSNRTFLIPLDQEDNLCNMLMDHNFSIFRNGEQVHSNCDNSQKRKSEEDDDQLENIEPRKLIVCESDNE